MARDRLNTENPESIKQVTKKDLELIILQLEDVAYRKASQCTKLALYNKLPDIIGEGLSFSSVESYYEYFLKNKHQKPYSWYINHAMRKINKIKDSIYIHSVRRVVDHADGSKEQRASVYVLNELGFFRIRSNINVNTGKGVNTVSCLRITDDVYNGIKEKYKKTLSFKEAEKKALEIDLMFHTHTSTPFCGHRLTTVRSNFVFDTSIFCDEAHFSEMKRDVLEVGGVENVAFFDAEWMQNFPIKSKEVNHEEIETCYQIGYCFGTGQSETKTFAPICDDVLDVQKYEDYLKGVGLSVEKYNEVIYMSEQAKESIQEALRDILEKTRLIIVSSKEDKKLLNDYFNCFCTDTELITKFSEAKVVVSHSLFVGYFTPKVQTLARLCGQSDALHTFSAGEDASYLASFVSDLVQYDHIDDFFRAKEEVINKAIADYQSTIVDKL